MKNLLGASILCLASAAFAQSEIPGELFAKLAADWYSTEQCAFEGRIKPETAAYGKQLLRQSLDKYQVEMDVFSRLVGLIRQKQKNGLPNANVCNVIAVEIEEIRLEVAAAEAKVQADAEKQRRDAQVKAQLEQKQRQEAEMEAYRQQQIRAADAAFKNQQMEAVTQQIDQMGQQFRDFGNRVQPRIINCNRTTMGASCVSY